MVTVVQKKNQAIGDSNVSR